VLLDRRTVRREAAGLELLRYAGANRLKVDIDYRAENGRRGPRRVEPYSLRRTNDRNLVLFVVNDRRQLRSYRIDRIAGIKPTTESSPPRTKWNSDPANSPTPRGHPAPGAATRPAVAEDDGSRRTARK
jgi:predicted DNA-binding transcriptional regulator YafY